MGVDEDDEEESDSSASDRSESDRAAAGVEDAVEMKRARRSSAMERIGMKHEGRIVATIRVEYIR